MSPTHSKPVLFQLTSDEVHIWCVSLDVSPDDCARLLSTLTSDERDRSARFRLEEHRRRFIVSHGALRQLLACYLQTRPNRIRYEYNTFGKPDLSSRIKFNLSHSADLALIAITDGAHVGVDLEYVRAQPDFVDIARRFFSTAEVEHLESLPTDLQAEAFFNCWTKTEACLKAGGEALANLDGAAKNSNQVNRWSVHMLQPAPGYVGALAIEGGGQRLEQRHWSVSDHNMTRL